MKFKLIIVLVTDDMTNKITDVGRQAGATGCTVITSARGEGLVPPKTFFGLSLESQRDMILFLVEQHRSRMILESIARAGKFDEKPGSGIAFQVDIEDAVGLASQLKTIEEALEDDL